MFYEVLWPSSHFMFCRMDWWWRFASHMQPTLHSSLPLFLLYIYLSVSCLILCLSHELSHVFVKSFVLGPSVLSVHSLSFFVDFVSHLQYLLRYWGPYLLFPAIWQGFVTFQWRRNILLTSVYTCCNSFRCAALLVKFAVLGISTFWCSGICLYHGSTWLPM